MNDKRVEKQYRTPDNLNTRQSIHDKYSTNKQGFRNWIYSHYEINKGFKILELGCGMGNMWIGKLSLLSDTKELVLSDFSDGMVAQAKANLQDSEEANKKLTFQRIDIQDIPYEDGYFDMVIANMMLYHVPDLQKGLAEVRRVLKKDGNFYCATYGENGIIDYVAKLLTDYGVEDQISRSFTLQNGKDILSKVFSSVTRDDYKDSLNVTHNEDMVDYIYSLSGITNLDKVDRDSLKERLDERTVNGVLHIPKEYGMFISK